MSNEHFADPALKTLGLVAPPADGPAILIYDIETAPALAWMWSAYDANIIDIEQDWYLLSFAYKWLNTKNVGFVSIFQDKKFKPNTSNDKHVADRLHALFDRADVVVAHNGDRFDRRKANAAFLKNGLGPPSPYQTVDTKKVAAREFMNYRNSLKDLGRLHELGAKMETNGFELWRRCMAGDPAAWKKMEQYNRQDVHLLDSLYWVLLPWMGLPGKPAHPNMGHWNKGELTCPKCGHHRLIKRGFHRTSVSEFQSLQCKKCGSYSRGRKREPQKDTGGVQAL